MEWVIMNHGGLSSMCNSLGTEIDGCYEAVDDCYDTLTGIFESLAEDDPSSKNILRQFAAKHIIEKELVPLLSDLQDNPNIFQCGIRLLVILTQPIECLQNGCCGDNDSSMLPWYWDVRSMLIEAKISCSSVKFISAVFREIGQIIEDAGDYDLVEDDREVINQCLLLIRNLLHIQDSPGQNGISSTHITLLKNLFECQLDEMLLLLLNNGQKEHWGVAVIQIISLLYRDLVCEIFINVEDTSSCGEESCDSSNCPHCEAAMDRAFEFEPIFSSGKGTPDNVSKRAESIVASSSTESNTMVMCERLEQDSAGISLHFQESCTIKNTCTYTESYSTIPANMELENCNNCEKPNKKSQKDMLKNDPGKEESWKPASKCTETLEKKSLSSSLSDEGLVVQLTDFTYNFLQSGFAGLVLILKHELLTITDQQTPPALDDSYFLWAISFFLKFGRRKEIDFKKIKEIFTVEVFGFLVYEAVSNGQEVLSSFSTNKSYAMTMRRLHLSVSALQEMIKTLTFHKERGLDGEDEQYLHNLECDLANMNNLRQVFLWLIHMYQPGCHSMLYLRDVIVTNHYFLLLLEKWLEQGFCCDKKVNMLTHVQQYAVNGVMQKYGVLLQNFVRNDHHVNNCIFTMMHHIAGDCMHPEVLLQEDIIKTFLQIYDANLPITKEMNDLMEYTIQQVLSTAEKNPMSCALRLFLESSENQENIFNYDTGNPIGSGSLCQNNPESTTNSTESGSAASGSTESGSTKSGFTESSSTLSGSTESGCSQKSHSSISNMDSHVSIPNALNNISESECGWTAEMIDRVVTWCVELEEDPDASEKIIYMLSEIGINKINMEVVNYLFKMGCLSTKQLESLVKSNKTLPTKMCHSYIETEGEVKHIENLSALEELSAMEDDKIVPHCVKKLQDDGFEVQLKLIQENILEAAYVKMDGENVNKKYIEEPITKYFTAKSKDVPIMLDIEEREKIGNNIYMLALMQQIGLKYDEFQYSSPMIPYDLTTLELVDIAKMLGHIEPAAVKFDLEEVFSNTDSPKKSLHLNDSFIHSKQQKTAFKVPDIAWMNLVQEYNISQQKQYQQCSRSTDLGAMETEFRTRNQGAMDTE